MPRKSMTLSISASCGVKRSIGESRRLGEELHQRVQPFAARVGKRVDAPRGIGSGHVSQLHRLGVGQTHDGRRVETHADREAAWQGPGA